MGNVIIPLNAYKNEMITVEEHESLISAISEAGADGVEIRKELLSPEDFDFRALHELVRRYNLFIVYSVPIPLWKEDGGLNKENVMQAINESRELGAMMVKFPLGWFRNEASYLKELKTLMREYATEIKLFVENDQTNYGGNIQNLLSFFENASNLGVPVKMTFDVGNWMYTGEDVFEAIKKLEKYTEYVHLKHVEEKNGQLISLPLPIQKNAKWKKILSYFSNDLPKALEFPLEPGNMTEQYVDLIKRQ
ncbi:sugar phosphate isomerase/epimerase family protein [Bacillus sp. AL-1R]